jgi:hypothetical protein
MVAYSWDQETNSLYEPTLRGSIYSTSTMDLAQFREYCLSKPSATEGTPFGPDVLVFKVSGKMFALAALDEMPTTVNLKCDPDLALELRDVTSKSGPVIT